MRRYILLLIVALSAASCWTVTEYSDPTRTTYARLLYSEVEYSLSIGVSTMQMALYLDEWITEEDEAAKDLLAETYFYDYTLYAGSSGNYSLNYVLEDSSVLTIEVETAGVSLKDKGAQWSISMNGEILTIDYIEDGSWCLSGGEFEYCTGFDLTFDLVELTDFYLNMELRGGGTSQYYSSFPGNGVYYEVGSTLDLMCYVPNQYLDYTLSWLSMSNGTITYELIDAAGSYPAINTYKADGIYTIEYRGYTEVYNATF